MKVVIILPCYNERDNIIPMINALQRQARLLVHDLHLLIVDDDSPDGTGDLARNAMRFYRNVHLITGKKEGLGAAYIRGMRHAMNMLNADVVFEMDADFSHDPSDVPRLLKEIDDRADFVIGSRYVTGGSIPKEWNLLRKANSFFGNLVARYVAGIYRVRDCTAGFRAIRTSTLRQIDFSALKVRGYAFQVALLHQAVATGARVKEIPVHFIDRKYGESKLGLSDIMEFVLNASWIRLRSLETFLKFSAVGAAGIVVNIGAFSLLLSLGTNKFVASPIAIELSILSNFFLNNYWTFKKRETADTLGIRGIKFNLVSLLSLGISYATFVATSMLFPKLMPQIHQLIGIVPAMFTNYFLNSYWTFARRRATPAPMHPTAYADRARNAPGAEILSPSAAQSTVHVSQIINSRTADISTNRS